MFQFASPAVGGWNSTPSTAEHYPQRARQPDHQYWSVTSTPTTSHYNHEPVIAFNAVEAGTYTSPNLTYGQGANSWVPTRSLSFGNVEGMHNHYQYSGPPHQFHPPDDQSGFAFPPHQQYEQQAIPPVNRGLATNASADQIGFQKPWNSLPSSHVPGTSGEQHTPILPSSFYPQQPSFVAGYNEKGEPTYGQSPQFYPVSNPG